jgi:dimethylaniline monooxygenase (N-oxide forming)
VIGAGASGIIACAELKRRGLPFTCFEIGERVGGLWLFKNSNGRGGAYRSLRINTSRDRSALAGFPMPADYPDYPRHELIARYLEAYATAFELHDHIKFRSRVVTVRPDGGAFEVSLDNGLRERFSAVVVANGHHHKRSFPPAVPGAFSGKILHSGDYIDPTEPADLVSKCVVVVGFGNSAVDIASELAGTSPSTRVLLSVRRGAWVLPRYALGRPLDQVSSTRGPLSLLPRSWRKTFVALWYRSTVGQPDQFGLPEPDHAIGDAHPTVSDSLLPLIREGRIEVKPKIVRFDHDRVQFADGSSERADAVVYATGYQLDFPFFDPSYLSAPNNELELYFRVFSPAHAGLYFVGLCQPLGPIFPVAQAQARLVAAHLAGDYCPPAAAEMARLARAERAAVRERYGSSPRHTMQVDFDDYLAAIAAEERAGAARTARQGAGLDEGPSHSL